VVPFQKVGISRINGLEANGIAVVVESGHEVLVGVRRQGLQVEPLGKYRAQLRAFVPHRQDPL